MTDAPLVSVGFPVRNGGEVFPLALASVLGQTHANLEIVLSDNASDDGTSERCAAAAAVDHRIRYTRHPEALPGLDHFRWCLEQATGDYFFWAAHDDLRSADYVEVLLAALLADRTAGMAFGDILLFHDYDDLSKAQPMDRVRGTEHGSLRDRMLLPWRSVLPIYGLYRTEVLRRYQGWELEAFGGDMGILASVATSSEILQVPGTSFYYWGDTEEAAAKRAQRERETAPRWRYVRLNWVIADAAARSTSRPRLPLFAIVHTTFWWWRLRGHLASRLPLGLVEDWRERSDLRRARRAAG